MQQYRLNLPRDFMNDIKISHTEQGLSLNDLSIVLGKQGIQSDAYEMTDIAELKNIRFPAIAIIDNNGLNHYIVIHQFNDKSKKRYFYP